MPLLRRAIAPAVARALACSWAALALVTVATTAPASVVFQDWRSVNSVPGNHRLTVTDTGTSFEWTLSVTPWNAEALALFVDLGAVDMPTSVPITNLIPSAPVQLVGRDSSASTCGTGCNLNGLDLPALAGNDWELVFRLGSTGFDGIQTYSWLTPDFGLGEGDIRLVGVRAQQLCGPGEVLPKGDCGGSDKAWAWPTTDRGPDRFPPTTVNLPPPPGVPAPGGLALVLVAGVAAGLMRRRVRRG